MRSKPLILAVFITGILTAPIYAITATYSFLGSGASSSSGDSSSSLGKGDSGQNLDNIFVQGPNPNDQYDPKQRISNFENDIFLSFQQKQLINKAEELAAQHAQFKHCSDAINQLYKQALGTRVWDTPRISTSSQLQTGDHVIYYNGNKYTGKHSVMILAQTGENRYLVFQQRSISRGSEISERTISPNLITHINRA